MDRVYKGLIQDIKEIQEHHEYLKEHKKFVLVNQEPFKPKTFKLI